ncbi:MAG: phytanoyl-CoA dioxygenase family protein [Phycisphaerae bacterium]|nr:phytanoyl-CoA dioxygenase family protein [Phycisphaerae bacterium]
MHQSESELGDAAAPWSHTPLRVAKDGWAVVDNVIEAALLDRVIADVSVAQMRAGLRNLLDASPAARELASHPGVRAIPERLLGRECFVTRAILFDKTADANWKVPWHQDTTIAVAERLDVPGFGPWSVKDGITHVQPPADTLARMVTVRVHLDDCGRENGPVRVLPRSHRSGVLSREEIERLRAVTKDEIAVVARGGLLVFVPLLLHASSPAERPEHRRVAHFEFAADELPGGLRWQLRHR